MGTLTDSTFHARSAASPDWVKELRSRGLEWFEKLPMPTSKEEVWRYVDLDFGLDEFALPDAPGAVLADGELAAAIGEVAGRALVVDGFTVNAAPTAGPSIFTSIAAAVKDHEAELRGAYLMGIPPDLDRFSAAHHAFGTDGVFLYVPKGANPQRPFFIDVQAVTPGALVLPRITVVVEAGASATVVIGYRSPDGVRAVAVPQIEASVRDGARLRLVTIQRWGNDVRAIAHQRLVVGRDATGTMIEAGIGARLGRLHFFVDLLGRGGSAEIDGLYFGHEDQVLDYRGFVTHAAPNTTSNMYLKGAVEDRARTVFTGLIRIEEAAQKTDAFQTNRNLVLSEEAGAESVPNLEILANDVRCGHGSTVGPLDEEERYYLMSRGLSRLRADRLQVRGFFEEVLARLPGPELAGPVRRIVNAKYEAAQQEGRA